MNRRGFIGRLAAAVGIAGTTNSFEIPLPEKPKPKRLQPADVPEEILEIDVDGRVHSFQLADDVVFASTSDTRSGIIAHHSDCAATWAEYKNSAASALFDAST